MRVPSWREQLEIMVGTTIFITTQGSSGFRYVFMPKGACVIVIGSPEGQNSGWPQPFFELEEFFRISYLTFLLYRVNENNAREYDVRNRSINGTLTGTSNPLYDAHIQVDPHRISDLVALALKSCHR